MIQVNRLAPYLAGAVIALVLWLAFRPVPDLPPEVAIGTIVIPPALFQKQLEDVGTRRGNERVTRREVRPTTHAVAPGAASSIVDRFVAAAVDTPIASPDDLPARGTENESTPQPLARDTVCVGVGGSLRGRNLALYSACAPGGGGMIDRYNGGNFDWSYESGRLNVSASRFRIPPAVKWVLIIGGSVYVGTKLDGN